ncbi:MAG TPA: membrane protein insertase YidC [Rhizomicrobium sp.]|jgi:YidC/Oxa1 family membrane protein insertase|nr:membrane protein insertase YidC [Rhizomicrobium sp.]
MNQTANNRNVIVASILCVAIFFAWQFFIGGPAMKAEQARQQAVAAKLAKDAKAHAATATTAGGVPAQGGAIVHLSRTQALAVGGARVAIDTPSVDGSLMLKGARIDDLRLKCYHERAGSNLKCDNSDKTNPQIVLLSPKGTDYPYFVDFGWIGDNLAVPSDQTVWTVKSGTTLSPGHPVTLGWDNGKGLVFTRVIAIDDQFLFTVTDNVTNKGGAPVALAPYGETVRIGAPQSALKASYMTTLHEGFVGQGSELVDPTYSKFEESGTPPITVSGTGGWLGITDKYWMATVIPPQNENFDGEFRASQFGDVRTFQADYKLAARSIAPGTSTTVTHQLFAGAKVVDTLRHYEDKQHIKNFTDAVDWGWFWFITQPLFFLLDYLYRLIGNFGLAILLLTVCVKAVTFPIANASAKTMAKMKKIQPEQEEIKKRFPDDMPKQQQAIMELYRREKVNPVSGCVPQLLVIPVFFSLYKVMYVTIEMRQAPFWGWIHDLSVPDPTSFINLFGLLPFNPHLVLPPFLAFLSLGVWPILMGCTQWVQTKLNPAPADPIQARMFSLMPIMFTFMFSAFPAGLVIYYTWNNILGIAQQWYIMSRNGVEVHLFKNLRLAHLFGGKTDSKAANDA